MEKSHREAEQRHDALLQALSANTTQKVACPLNAGVQKAHQNAVDHLQEHPRRFCGRRGRREEGVRDRYSAGSSATRTYAYQAPVPAPSMSVVLQDPVSHGQAATSYWSKLRANVRLGKASGQEVRAELQSSALHWTNASSRTTTLIQKLDEELRKTEQAAVATPTKRADSTNSLMMRRRD